MVPQQHLVLSWVLSNLGYDKRRDRIVATICGVVPDIDGLGIIVDKIRGDGTYNYYFLWHHKAGHNILFFFILMIITYFICKRKILPVFVGAIAFLTHIFLDLAGSGGPDGSIWALWPLWPFSEYRVSVSWQWSLNDWRNTLIAAVFIVIMIIIGSKKNRSVLEVFSQRLDKYCINVVKGIFKIKST
jgi:membrane-bound metal-dependent hydrolase YbcI (DUF457 family)